MTRTQSHSMVEGGLNWKSLPLKLFAGGPQPLYVLGFGCLCIGTQIYFSYEQSVRGLKWLTLALFAYVAVILAVSVSTLPRSACVI